MSGVRIALEPVAAGPPCPCARPSSPPSSGSPRYLPRPRITESADHLLDTPGLYGQNGNAVVGRWAPGSSYPDGGRHPPMRGSFDHGAERRDRGRIRIGGKRRASWDEIDPRGLSRQRCSKVGPRPGPSAILLGTSTADTLAAEIGDTVEGRIGHRARPTFGSSAVAFAGFRDLRRRSTGLRQRVAINAWGTEAVRPAAADAVRCSRPGLPLRTTQATLGRLPARSSPPRRRHARPTSAPGAGLTPSPTLGAGRGWSRPPARARATSAYPAPQSRPRSLRRWASRRGRCGRRRLAGDDRSPGSAFSSACRSALLLGRLAWNLFARSSASSPSLCAGSVGPPRHSGDAPTRESRRALPGRIAARTRPAWC